MMIWLSIPCDFTTLVYFLSNYVKSYVYINNSQPIPEIKDENIRVNDKIGMYYTGTLEYGYENKTV